MDECLRVGRSGWIVAAMEEKNCTEMEGYARQGMCVCVVCCVVKGMIYE